MRLKNGYCDPMTGVISMHFTVSNYQQAMSPDALYQDQSN